MSRFRYVILPRLLLALSTLALLAALFLLCCSCACSMFCGKAKRRFRRADARKPMFSVSTRP